MWTWGCVQVWRCGSECMRGGGVVQTGVRVEKCERVEVLVVPQGDKWRYTCELAGAIFGGIISPSLYNNCHMLNHSISTLWIAIRVSSAETRLTVYRGPHFTTQRVAKVHETQLIVKKQQMGHANATVLISVWLNRQIWKVLPTYLTNQSQQCF